MLRFGLMLAIVLSLAGWTFAQQAPGQAAPPKLLEKPAYILGPAAIQEYPEQNYFFVSTEATQKTMSEVMRRLVPQLIEAAKAAGVEPGAGPMVLVYTGVTPDPEAAFEVEAGLIVPENVKAAGDGEVRKLEPMKCATMVYTGGMANMTKAFESLFASIMTSGQTPNMEMRQMMLYWESEQSQNNIMLLMVGIQ